MMFVKAIAFADLDKESQETFVHLFGLVFDHVVVKMLPSFSRLPNIHPRVSSFDCIFYFLL